MMPEEGRSGVGVVSDAVQQIRGILVHTVVYDDGFVLSYHTQHIVQYIAHCT
jgi:hypothetical protein